MLGIKSDARIIFEEEFTRQVRRTGWRIFAAAIPILLLLAAFVAPLIADALSDDDESLGSKDLIGYIDNAGITDSLEDIPGIIRISDLDVGTKSLAEGNIEGLFVISSDYVVTGEIDWYRITGGLASEDGTGDIFRNVLRAAVADESLEPELVARILQPASYTLFSIDEEGRPEASGTL
jgi:hypothetical protein